MSDFSDRPDAPNSSSAASGQADTLDKLGIRLESWATKFALAGGIILTVLAVFTIVSVVGRAAFDSPILGDSEITEMAAGIAIFLFLPYCQIKGGNIVVDFFTTKLATRARATLDAVNNVIFSLVIGILAWRMLIGGIDAWNHNEISMMLKLPTWLGYAVAILAMGLLTLTCLYSTLIKCREARR